MRARRPDPAPLEVDAVKVVIAATALWAIALLASLVFLSTLRRDGHLWWVATAVVGLLLGFLGIWVTRRRQSRAADTHDVPPPLA
ncbi:MAG: DUF2530 domain-containing protein [Mycobacteriales bacterium]